MSVVDRTTASDLAPEKPLRSWVDGLLPGSGALALEPITGGHSNVLFRVSRSGYSCVLRRPPKTSNARTAHDMEREYRALTALENTDVPHAHPIAFCSREEVIGSQFYLMEELDGVVLSGELSTTFKGHGVEVGRALAETLATIHELDWLRAGLEGFGRPEGYVERQVSRWTKQLDSYAFRRPMPALDEVARWLASHVPTMSGRSLIHGDYGPHNVMFDREAPVCVAAVVDWETSTIGDPLADLGYLLGTWLDAAEAEQWPEIALPFDVDGFPSRSDLVAWYEDRRSITIDLDVLKWHQVMGRFKISVILEGSYARYRRGEADDPFFASFETRVPMMADHALAIVEDRA
jgi:aminoglycoside phosphotransferase (APT) family kinase protein